MAPGDRAGIPETLSGSADGAGVPASPGLRGLPPPLARPPVRPPRRGRRIAGIAVVLLAAGAGLLGLRYGVARPVGTLPVTAGPFQADLSGPGTLDAISRADVGSSIQGVLTTLRVDRNDRVLTGDILAEVDVRDLAAQRDAAVASRQAALKAVEASAADVRRAEATLANARATLQRHQDLRRSGTSSQATLDASETAARQGEADLARARAAVLQAEAQEAAAAASVAASGVLVDRSVIRAPIDGVVVSRSLNLGDLVTPSTPILAIADPATIVLTARFDESAIAAVAPGQAAVIRFTSAAADPVPGVVRRISREVDTETREFTVDIAPVRLPENWAIGQRGTATIALAAEDGVVAVPVSAIGRRAGQPGVWVVSGGRAVWHAVRLGAIGGDRVAIRDGLAAGDRVVARPERAFPFMRVADRGERP